MKPSIEDPAPTMLATVLRRFGLGRIAQNTVLGMLWEFVRIASQALWVVAIARSLGASGYGSFAGIAGLATTVGGFSGLGTGLLLLQSVSRDHSTFDAHWRKTVLTTLGSGLVLTVLFTVIARLIAEQHATIAAIAAIGLSELVCYPLIYAAGFAFQAHERLGWSGSIVAMMSGTRLFAVAAFWYLATTRDLATYAWFHLAASMLSTLCAFAMVHTILRPRATRFSLHMNEAREGLSFSMVSLTGYAVTELDKTLALRLVGSEIAGVYSAAYRLASALTLPVTSLVLAARPRLFRQGADRAAENPHLLRHLVLTATACGLTASVALYLLAGLLPPLLGEDFKPAARAAQLLILIPLLYSLRLIGCTALMTSGRQMVRVLIEALGVVILICLALLWMPKYGLVGIAMTITTTEALLATGTWVTLWYAKQPRSRRRY